jgi:putative RecB family exonuclease
MTVTESSGTATTFTGPSLSPSRAADFKTCPLLFRFRTIDRLPEQPTPDQVRGTLVHAVLERLFDLPPAERTRAAAEALVEPQWLRLLDEQSALATLFTPAGPPTPPDAPASSSPDATAPPTATAPGVAGAEVAGAGVAAPGVAGADVASAGVAGAGVAAPGVAEADVAGAGAPAGPSPTPATTDPVPGAVAAAPVPGTLAADPVPGTLAADPVPGTVAAAPVAVVPAQGGELVEPMLDGMPLDADARLEAFFASARGLLGGYFAVEDPTRLDPAEREALVSTLVDEELLIRGYIDRLDVSPGGDLRVVDYKTGGAPREAFEGRALFQLKFYALVLWRTRGVVPRVLRLLYLKDQEICDYSPDAEELERFERTLVALSHAIERAKQDKDFRAKPSKLCGWCSHQALCPEFGGTPPPYPERAPEPDAPPQDLLSADG